jgi:hypothetical protein
VHACGTAAFEIGNRYFAEIFSGSAIFGQRGPPAHFAPLGIIG